MIVDDFKISDSVVTSREICAGRNENGPFVCHRGTKGIVVKVESGEWDGVHVELETGVLWWFKPSQLDSV